MPEIPYNTCLLIACRAIHYFMDAKLLKKNPDDTVVPADNVESLPIAQVLKDVKQDDDDFGLHGIDTILKSLDDGCGAHGVNLQMNWNTLGDSQIIFNIKSLAKWLESETQD
jgi:hypothetical protein